MLKFKLIFSVLKSHIKSVINGIYHNRYFHKVELYNKKNISINFSSNIDKGTRIWVIKPNSNKINIDIKSACWIGRDVEIQTNYESKIVLEEGVSIQDRCKLLGNVYIGQDTLLAPEVYLSSGNHHYNEKPELLIKEQDCLFANDQKSFVTSDKPIFIGEDCWLGKNVILKQGIHIGRGAIVAANSFVNKNVGPYEVVGGIPAKFLKKRLDFKPPSTLDFNQTVHYPYFYHGFDHRNITDDGFLSKNNSLCVLQKNIEAKSIVISGSIILNGRFLVWYNNDLILNKTVLKGVLYETLKSKKLIKQIEISNPIDIIIKDLTDFDAITFEFIPDDKVIKKCFKINKLTIL